MKSSNVRESIIYEQVQLRTGSPLMETLNGGLQLVQTINIVIVVRCL